MSDLNDTMPCDSFSRVLASTTSALPLAAAQDAADGDKYAVQLMRGRFLRTDVGNCRNGDTPAVLDWRHLGAKMAMDV